MRAVYAFLVDSQPATKHRRIDEELNANVQVGSIEILSFVMAVEMRAAQVLFEEFNLLPAFAITQPHCLDVLDYVRHKVRHRDDVFWLPVGMEIQPFPPYRRPQHLVKLQQPIANSLPLSPSRRIVAIGLGRIERCIVVPLQKEHVSPLFTSIGSRHSVYSNSSTGRSSACTGDCSTRRPRRSRTRPNRPSSRRDSSPGAPTAGLLQTSREFLRRRPWPIRL